MSEKIYELKVGSGFQNVRVSKVDDNNNEYIETRKEKIFGYEQNIARIAKAHLDEGGIVQLTAINYESRGTTLGVLAKLEEMVAKENKRILSNVTTKVVENRSRKRKTATVYITTVSYQ